MTEEEMLEKYAGYWEVLAIEYMSRDATKKSNEKEIAKKLMEERNERY